MLKSPNGKPMERDRLRFSREPLRCLRLAASSFDSFSFARLIFGLSLLEEDGEEPNDFLAATETEKIK